MASADILALSSPISFFDAFRYQPLAIRTVCPTHRCCLRIAKSLPATVEQCQWLIRTPSELETAVIDELIRLERVIAAARGGTIIHAGEIALDGGSLLTIFRDLTTYCVESWDTSDYRRICWQNVNLADSTVSLPASLTAIVNSICRVCELDSSTSLYILPIRRYDASLSRSFCRLLPALLRLLD